MQSSTPTNSLFPFTYFSLICRKDETTSICISEGSPSQHEYSRIVSKPSNSNDYNQIFMIQKIGDYGTQYEIICCVSDFVLDYYSGAEVVLRNGKQSKYQLWKIQPITSTGGRTYYSIIPVSKPDYALALEGELRLCAADPNSTSQQFRFEKSANPILTSSCLIINKNSKKAVDVPASTQKQGERLVIWEPNYRWNQRWVFEQVKPNLYVIRSVINGLCIDIAGGCKQNQSKIIQWSQHNGTNQQWILQPVSQANTFRIQSAHNPYLYLGIRKQDTSNGAYLQVTSSNSACTYWQFDGGFPKIAMF